MKTITLAAGVLGVAPVVRAGMQRSWRAAQGSWRRCQEDVPAAVWRYSHRGCPADHSPSDLATGAIDDDRSADLRVALSSRSVVQTSQRTLTTAVLGRFVLPSALLPLAPEPQPQLDVRHRGVA